MSSITFSITLLLMAAVFTIRHVNGDACDDSYLLSASAPSPSSVLSVAAINGILTEHNRARRNVQPAAQVMPMLRWNQTLADFAQEYMNTCVGLVHSSSSTRQNPTRFGWSYIGENLAAGSSSAYLVATGGQVSTAAWNAEIVDYHYGNNSCNPGRACGHYTQNIWATTTHVGCGYTRCESLTYKNYWSCVYGPGGNYVGQKPYVQATGSVVAACQNGSTGSPATTSAATTSQPTSAPAGSTAAPATPTTASPGTQSTTSPGTSAPAASTQSPGTSAPAAPPTPSPPFSPNTPAPTLTASNGATLPPPRVATIRLSGSSFAPLVASSLTSLVLAVRNDLSAVLGIPASGITIEEMKVGSLIVRFTVPSNYDTNLTTSLSTQVGQSGWLVNTQGLYNSVSSETITLQEANTTEKVVVPTPVPPPTPASTPLPAGSPPIPAPPSPGLPPTPGAVVSPSVQASACNGGCVGIIVISLALVVFIGVIVACALMSCMRRTERKANERKHAADSPQPVVANPTSQLYNGGEATNRYGHISGAYPVEGHPVADEYPPVKKKSTDYDEAAV